MGGPRMILRLVLSLLCMAAIAFPTRSAQAADRAASSCLPRALEQPAQQLDAIERDRLALSLLPCLGDPDPQIRDTLAFGTLSSLLRDSLLSTAARDSMRAELVRQLRAPADADGFRHPFVVLALSELVRADRLAPAMDMAQRQEIVGLATQYLRSLTDYRGFVSGEGWRHGVAHGADLALQLLVHDGVDPSQSSLLLDALATQIAPPGEIAYVHGEPERFARAVFFAHSRGLLPPTFWESWFNRVSEPAPLANWEESFRSTRGLARRHNTIGFLTMLHYFALTQDDPNSRRLAALIEAALKRVL